MNRMDNEDKPMDDSNLTEEDLQEFGDTQEDI